MPRSRTALRSLLWPGFALALVLGAATPLQASCGGVDLFPRLEAERPDQFAAMVAAADAAPFARRRLFRVSRPGVEPSHRFGTIHVSDPRATEVLARPAVAAAIDDARTVALELVEVGGLDNPEPLKGLGARTFARVLAKADERSERLLEPAQLAQLEAAIAARG